MGVSIEGKPTWYFWKNDKEQVLYGGTSYATRQKLSDSIPRMSKVFVHFDGSISIQDYSGGDNKGFTQDCGGCEVTGKIIDIKCKAGGSTCNAAWAPNLDQNQALVCDSCSAPSGSTSHCTGDFQVTNQHSITTSSTSIDQLGGSYEFGFEAGIDFIADGKMKASYKVDYQHTWQKSKSQTDTTTSTVSSSCALDLPAGKNATAAASFAVGTLKGDVIMTVLRKDACNVQDQSYHPATVEISNVPVTQASSSCKWVGAPCAQLDKPILI